MTSRRIWFTSDLHFGHNKVAEIRGFSNTMDHDATLVDKWASVVGPHDQVWVLGDLAVSSPTYALEVIGGLPGEKHLIWGNHDRGHPQYRDAHRAQHQYLEVFASIATHARRRIDRKSVLVSHFPYKGDTETRNFDRMKEWRVRPTNQPIIHGHTHSSKKVTYALYGYNPGQTSIQVHVGVDAWDLAPVNIDEITAILRENSDDNAVPGN